jgi:hypothetical protein
VQKVQNPSQSSQHPIDQAEKILKFKPVFCSIREDFHWPVLAKVVEGGLLYKFDIGQKLTSIWI